MSPRHQIQQDQQELLVDCDKVEGLLDADKDREGNPQEARPPTAQRQWSYDEVQLGRGGVAEDVEAT